CHVSVLARKYANRPGESMPVTSPTPDQLKRIADEMGLSLTDQDIASFSALMAPNIEAYNVIDQLPDNLPAVKYKRGAGYRPLPEENRYNGWYYKRESR